MKQCKLPKASPKTGTDVITLEEMGSVVYCEKDEDNKTESGL